MRRYSSTVTRWLIGVLATFSVTAAIAVPLLTPAEGSGRFIWTSSTILDGGGHPLPLSCKKITNYTQDCVILARR
jgi:hypothetical protein